LEKRGSLGREEGRDARKERKQQESEGGSVHHNNVRDDSGVRVADARRAGTRKDSWKASDDSAPSCCRPWRVPRMVKVELSSSATTVPTRSG